MLNTISALLVNLKAVRDTRRFPTVCVAVSIMAVTAGLLLFASLTDGATPAQGLDDNHDGLRVRAQDLTLAPGAAVPPLHKQQDGAISSGTQDDGGPTSVKAQDLPKVGSGRGYKAIAVGPFHTCGIRTTGELLCWGHAVGTPPAGQFQAVAPGVDHTCAIRQDGTVDCWGKNGFGQSTAPDGVFTAIGAGQTHGCGLRDNGQIVCWGRSLRDDSSLIDAPAEEFISLSVGYEHNCAVRTDGAAICWGANHFGAATPPEGVFRSVSAGERGSCGILTSGSLVCWGVDAILGRETPEGVFQSVSVGINNACALREDGTVVCWGGAEDWLASTLGNAFVSVSTNYEHTCGLRTNGVALCWGQNDRGQLNFPGEPEATADIPMSVSNVAVCSRPDAGEVVISWDAALPTTHYRIGYVNMVQDYPRAKASVTGEWIEAFIYLDVNARNVPVGSDGRAQYTLRRLVQGDRHAFTVLASNDVTNTPQTISGTYHWPQNPRWKFLTVADPGTDCSDAAAAQPTRTARPSSPSITP